MIHDAVERLQRRADLAVADLGRRQYDLLGRLLEALVGGGGDALIEIVAKVVGLERRNWLGGFSGGDGRGGCDVVFARLDAGKDAAQAGEKSGSSLSRLRLGLRVRACEVLTQPVEKSGLRRRRARGCGCSVWCRRFHVLLVPSG